MFFVWCYTHELLWRSSALDSIYKWAVDFLENHVHCTKYAVAIIQASIIQGLAIGPASYVVTAADLHPVHDCNRIFKFASSRTGTRTA